MNYNDLTELAKAKNILLKTICDKVGYTRAGLKPAIENETIELRKLKVLCDTLRISPSQFFETGTYGITINTGGQSANSQKQLIDIKDREIEMLKQLLSHKDEIIELLKQRYNDKTGYGNVAEP